MTSAHWHPMCAECRRERRRATIPTMPVTDDPNDPRLRRGVDQDPTGQHDTYLVLSAAERAKGYVRPLRRAYIHQVCGAKTTMALAIAETYARDPRFYGATFCTGCGMHLAVDEFIWDGTDPPEKVGS